MKREFKVGSLVLAFAGLETQASATSTSVGTPASGASAPAGPQTDVGPPPVVWFVGGVVVGFVVGYFVGKNSAKDSASA